MYVLLVLRTPYSVPPPPTSPPTHIMPFLASVSWGTVCVSTGYHYQSTTAVMLIVNCTKC